MRYRRVAAVILGVSALAWSLTAINVPAGALTGASTSKLASLAKAGVSGSFHEVYRVVGPVNGTVEVTRQAARGRRPYVTGPGKWSFVFRASTGISSQWIEEGSRAWDCWHFSGVVQWTCSGPGTYETANGFILSVEPYIPGVVLTEVEALQEALKTKPTPVKHLSLFGSTSAHFGPLQCLKVEAVGIGNITWCFDRHGVLVTQRGGSSSYWTSVTLLEYQSAVPHSAFQLLGPSTSSGPNFTTVPI